MMRERLEKLEAERVQDAAAEAEALQRKINELEAAKKKEPPAS
jgi:hypothetical protein